MENGIIKTENKLAITEISQMAKIFAESGMFADTKQMAQAFVKIQAGQELGIAPFQAMSGINIIMGKPTVGSGIIAAKIKSSGKYDYKVLQQDENACVLEFFEGGKSIGKSSFTIADAKKAGTKNLDKFPRNMLFARAISNGVKWFTPDVFLGPVYVPEEMNEVEETKAEPSTTATEKVDATLKPNLCKDYLDLVEKSDLHTAEEKDLRTKDCETWSDKKLTSAIIKFKAEIIEREKIIEENNKQTAA